MKKILVISSCLLMLAWTLSAQTRYYVSAGGNDSHSGTSPGTSWKSITKVNSAMINMNPGDSILFKSDDRFSGSIQVSRSGNASARINFDKYGDGKLPVIDGAIPVSGWLPYATNIWVAPYGGTLNNLNNFFINSVSQQIGRYPNANASNGGYLKIQSSTGPTNLTDNSLQGLPNWTGATAVVKARIFILNKPYIQSQTGNTLNFSGTGAGYTLTNGYGYFIQNHLATLDQAGEWYYDNSQKKVYVYANQDPSGLTVQAPAEETGLSISGKNYISIKNLRFEQSNTYGIKIENATGIEVKGCEFNNLHNGIWADQVQITNIDNNNLNRTNNNAIYLTGTNCTSNFNTIKNTALRAGMGDEKNNQYNAMNIVGAYTAATNNKIDSVGYIGIRFEGNHLNISNNEISNFTLTKSDAGGIYSFKGFAPTYQYGNNIISGNTIHDAYPNMYGSLSTAVNPNYAVGIYLDNNSQNNSVTGNTVYNIQGAGMMINIGGKSHQFKNNTFYNNLYGFACYPDTAAANKQNQITGNIFFSKAMYQQIGHIQALNAAQISSIGTIDSNYYCQPFEKDSSFVQTSETGYTPRITRGLDLQGLQAIGYEPHGHYIADYIPAFTINSAGTNRITPAAYQTGINVNPNLSTPSGSMLSGTYYQLQFFAKAITAATQLNIAMMGSYGAAKFKSIQVDTIRKQMSIWFSPYADVNSTTLNFALQSNNKVIRIDQVQFQELNTSNTNPDDYIRFLSNPGSTPKTINLGSQNYQDLKRNSYTGLISLPPFSSIVLLKR